MVAMQNRKESGLSRRKSCTAKDYDATAVSQNLGTRAKNFLDRAMGRSGEQRQLIEVNFIILNSYSKRICFQSSVDEYGSATPHLLDRRIPVEESAFDNEALDRSMDSSFRRARKGKLNENGSTVSSMNAIPSNSPIVFSGSVKSDSEDRWREKEGERLANWSRTASVAESSSSILKKFSIENPPIRKSTLTFESTPSIIKTTALNDNHTAGSTLWNRLKNHHSEGNQELSDDKRHSSSSKASRLTKVVGIGEKWTTALKQMQRNRFADLLITR